jgi:transposase InsO family protein
MKVDQARWHEHYNWVRPQSAIGYRPAVSESDDYCVTYRPNIGEGSGSASGY